MSGNFRNNLQAAILFDGHADILPSMGLNQFRMAMLSKGIPWRILHENRDSVVLAGPDDLQLTCSYFDKPADHAVFSQVLASPLTASKECSGSEKPEPPHNFHAVGAN